MPDDPKLSHLVFPTVHLNGTDGEQLLGHLVGVISAIDHAREMMRHAWPNGRDYYPQGASVAQAAQDQAEAQDRKLAEVRDELQLVWEHVQEQVDARAARRGTR